MRLTWSLVLILWLAFAARTYELQRSPLRGDEAFAVRVWAAPPLTVLRDLADHEPHPLGAYFGFFLWKQVAGNSEFAMRMLPVFLNWLGLAGVFLLARNLFQRKTTALLAALLWAINPFLIWHAQDVRNYAIWAGLSVFAMALFVRAVRTDRPRAWAGYALVQLLALYTFFLEPLLLMIQTLYVILHRPGRRVIQRLVLTWTLVTILLIPWLIQAWHVANSGYEGTLSTGSTRKLFTWFIPAVFTGLDTVHWTLPAGAATLLLLLATSSLSPLAGSHQRQVIWSGLYAFVPPVILLATATQLSVFHPRYVIAAMPGIMLLAAAGLTPFLNRERPHITGLRQRVRFVFQLSLVLIIAIGLARFANYYAGNDPKAPDWRALAAFFDERAQPDDLIIQSSADPAFVYYYGGPAAETSLPDHAAPAAVLRPELNYHTGFWLVGEAHDAAGFLTQELQLIDAQRIADFPVQQFRPWSVARGEWTTSADVTFGTIARLRGYSIQGPSPAPRAITVLLYWEPLRQTARDYKVFVHLLGPPKSDGNPLWDQDDTPPLRGFASTTAWEPGTIFRDPYRLLDDAGESIPPGTYTIVVGYYDPATGERLIASSNENDTASDSYPLFSFEWPPAD